MKKSFTRIMAALALLVFMAPSMVAWAEEFTYDFSTGGTYNSNANPVTNTWVTDYFTILQEKGTSTSAVANYLTAPRWYQNHLITITPAENVTITSIVINCGGTNNGQTITASTGSVTASGNNSTWTGSITSSNPVVLTMGKQCRPSSIVVTYSASGSITPTCATPTFTPAGGTYTEAQSVEISSDTEDATIYYTTDGNDPTTSSYVYSTAIHVSTTTTIKAMAVKADYNNSEIASATYTIVEPISGYTIDFENEAPLYSDWTFTNMESHQTTAITAHGGTYYGTTGGKATASITTQDKIATPYTLTCYVSKTSTNTTPSTWYIQVSSDGSTWTNVETRSATDMDKGEWKEFTANLTQHTNVYVRVYYSGSTAVRTIDDLELITTIPSTPYINITEPDELAYSATEGSILYEIANYEAGTMSATTDANWISNFTYEQADEIGEVGFTTTENNTLYARTATITLTYTYGDNQTTTTEVTVTQNGNSNLPGGASNPYTVAQAIEATPESGNSDFIYVHGIVSGIVEEYNSQYHNISYNISDDGTTTSAQLEAYRGKGLNNANFTSADDIKEGDIVTIYGQLTNYNGTKELAAGNYLTAFERPTSTEPSITLGSYEFSVSAEGEEGVLEVTYQNITEIAAEVYFCNAEGTAATYDWITAEINNANNVEYLVEPNDGTARTAYFKVWAYDDELNEVYSDLVTINQGAPAVIDLRGVTAPLTFNAGSFTSSGNGYQDYDEVTYTGDNNVNYAGWTLKQVMKSGNNMQMKKGGAGQVIMPTIKTDYGFTLTVTAETNSVLVSDGSKSTETTFSTTATTANVVISTGDVYAVISTITIIPTPYILTINGYTDVTEGSNNKGYYLIASPVNVDPANVGGMTDGNFDLYYYDHNANDGLEWRNYEAETFNLVPGTGYLYAKKATTEGETFSFNLTGTPYNGDGVIPTIAGWNLIGNPFGVEAEISADYYAMNQAGSELTPVTASTNVAAMQGVFVYTETASSVIFVEAATNGGSDGKGNLAINVTGTRGTVIDRAIVRFGEGRQLPKFQLNPNNTKIYFAQADNDYAVVCSASEGEMPVSFRAAENGTYTLSFSAENTEMRYMHLIDNMTGNDIDLLQTPSYSFEAKTTDYANRFRIVFKANTNVEEMNEEQFAFFNGSEWVINSEGEATLQVIDMMGRVVSSQTVNGNANVNINDAKGVYVIRLIQNDLVKTQKIVKE